MKHLKRLLSTVLAVVMLIPSAIPTTYAHPQEPETEGLHAFTSSEQLIKDAVEMLREQGSIAEQHVTDPALVESVEKDSEKTYNEVKTAVLDRLMNGLTDGKADLSDLNLDKSTMEQVMDEVLYDNYLYRAITGLNYSTKGDKVTTLSFDASEGFQSAMGAIEDEKQVEDEDLQVEVMDMLDYMPELDINSLFPSLMDGETACKNHTVGAGALLGDVNHDGKVSVKDLAAVRELIAGSKTDDAADVNKDGAVNDADLTALRQMIVDEKSEPISGEGQPDVKFEWALQQDFTPRDKDGKPLDVMNHPELQQQIANGGLLYMPNRETGKMEIQQGVMPDIYWGLEKFSFRCAKCGQEIVLQRNHEDPTDPVNAQLDQLVVRYNVYVDMATHETEQYPIDQPYPYPEKLHDPEKNPQGTVAMYTQVSVAQYMDDTFAVDENQQPISGLYVDTNGNNNDNTQQKIQFYYGMFSAFNADHADFFGVPGRYWTTKNSDADPLAAIKSLCNIPLDQPIPPANMDQLIQMLPQAFMSYVLFYGPELTAVMDEGVKVVNSVPNATRVQKLLLLHDWVAENTIFDMGTMTDVTGGDPETDPIQMTAFGSLLSRQLNEVNKYKGMDDGEGYYGCICLGYAAAYATMIQKTVYPEAYHNEDGTWKTADQVGTNDMVDYGQVMFYSNTANTSIAGEGFGGGYFNNVHYYNLVKVPNSPKSGGDEDNPRVGDWFFTDVCYDDIFVECMSQYRAEADGSLHHDYFLVSPLSMNKIWGNAVDYISNLHDGVEFKTKVDENGNPVPYPEHDTQHYNPKDPNHPMHVTVKAPNEEQSNNTCYEDTWFSGACSKIYNDGKNWYYIDKENTTVSFADKAKEDENGNYKFDFDLKGMADKGIDFRASAHATRADITKQGKLKERPMNAPDYWDVEKDDSSSQFPGMGGNSQMDQMKKNEYKEDPHDTVLFNYGNGKFTKNDADLSKDAQEHYTYTDQFPGLTTCLGMSGNLLYFNLGNKVHTYDVSNDTYAGVVKTYGKVNATSDGRKFLGSSYHLDPNGTALSVTNNPIAGLLIHDVYRPTYQTVDNGQGQQVPVFNGLEVVPTLSVNIGTDYSFTAAFQDGASAEDNVKTMYTKQAYNYNADYNQVTENNIDADKRDKNTNKEFLWCANILDEIPMAKFTPETSDPDMSDCTAQEVGHNWEYNAEEECYICKTCLLHARNIAVQDPDFDISMFHTPSSGMGDFEMGGISGIIGGDQEMPETTDPTNGYREAAILKGGKNNKDGEFKGGDIVVTVTAHEGVTKVPTAVKYWAEGTDEAEAKTVIANAEGKFVIQKPEDFGPMKVAVVTADAFTVTSSIPENTGSIAIDKQAAVAGDTVQVTVTPAEGYDLKNLTIKTADEAAADVAFTGDIKAEPAVVTFEMPAANVVINAETERVYKVEVSAVNGTIATKNAKNEPCTEFAAGDEVYLDIKPQDGFVLGELKIKDAEDKDVAFDADFNRFVMPASDVTLTAAFKKGDKLTVTVNNGKADKEEYKAGETVTVTATVGDNQEFQSWTTDSDGVKFDNAKSATTTFTMPNHSVTVSAKIANIYTVTFDYNDGKTEPTTAKTNAAGIVKMPANPTRDGYKFVGWFTAKDGGEQISNGHEFTADTTIYAHWNAVTYPVTVVGGTCKNNVTQYAEGKTVTIIAQTKEGEHFTGWTVNEGGVTLADAKAATTTFTMPGKAVKVTANFEKDAPVEPTMTGIKVTTPPTKTEYVVGENFDIAGMVVSAVYDDQTTKALKGTDWTVTDGTALKADQKTVTIAYGTQFKTTQAITVKAAEKPAVVTGIEITKPPKSTVYGAGDNFYANGMEVSAVYDDGSKKALAENDWTAVDGQNLKVEQTSVTIKYGEFTAVQPITVKVKELESIRVGQPPKKKVYTEGEVFNTHDMTVIAHYNVGNEEFVGHEELKINDGKPLEAGQTEVVIEYQGKTTTQAVTVNPKTQA